MILSGGLSHLHVWNSTRKWDVASKVKTRVKVWPYHFHFGWVINSRDGTWVITAPVPSLLQPMPETQDPWRCWAPPATAFFLTAQACWPSCHAAVWQCAVCGCLLSRGQLWLEPTEQLYPKSPHFIKSFPQWDHNHLYPVPSPGKRRLQGALAKKEAAIILITEMWLGWEGLLCLPTKHAICSSVSTSDWIYSLSER